MKRFLLLILLGVTCVATAMVENKKDSAVESISLFSKKFRKVCTSAGERFGVRFGVKFGESFGKLAGRELGAAIYGGVGAGTIGLGINTLALLSGLKRPLTIRTYARAGALAGIGYQLYVDHQKKVERYVEIFDEQLSEFVQSELAKKRDWQMIDQLLRANNTF